MLDDRFLKKEDNASATSAGSWNRRSGDFSIILATTDARSAGTSGRTRFNGRASVAWWARRVSYSVPPWNGSRPLSR